MGSTTHKAECPEYRKQNYKHFKQDNSCVDGNLRGRKNTQKEVRGSVQAVIQVNDWHTNNVSTQDDQIEAEKCHKEDMLQFPKVEETQQQ